MNITISMPVADSDWLCEYAARMEKHAAEVVAAAIDRARFSRAIETPPYVEPGTSVTAAAVVEIDLTLTAMDAQWLLQRAALDCVSPSAVLSDALRRYRTVAPPTKLEPGWARIIGSQTTFYRRIESACADVAAGKLSPEEADQTLALATAIRLYCLLPHVNRDELRDAVVAAVRELCVNHPGLRRAHGRDR